MINQVNRDGLLRSTGLPMVKNKQGIIIFVSCNNDLSAEYMMYMMCDFSTTRHEGGDVSLDGQVVVQKDTFRCYALMKILGIEFQLAG